jgi:hypothetical protein
MRQRSQLSQQVVRATSSVKECGLRLLPAAKAAVSIVRGSDVVTRREQQAIWNVADETAAHECEQAARLLTLSADYSETTKIIVDQFTRQAARIRLLRTDNSRGKRFFEQGRNSICSRARNGQ